MLIFIFTKAENHKWFKKFDQKKLTKPKTVSAFFWHQWMFRQTRESRKDLLKDAIRNHLPSFQSSVVAVFRVPVCHLGVMKSTRPCGVLLQWEHIETTFSQVLFRKQSCWCGWDEALAKNAVKCASLLTLPSFCLAQLEIRVVLF